MDDVLYELKYTILAMLDKNVQKADISPSEMCTIKEAVCTLHYMAEIDKIEDEMKKWDEDYSERRSYARRRSPTTGRYMSGDDRSYNRSSYSDGKDSAMRALERAMDNASSEHERQSIRESMDALNRN